MNWARDEVVDEYFFRVSTYIVCAWGDALDPRPSEIQVRMEVPGAPATVILRLRSVAEAEELLVRVAALKALVWEG